MTSKVFYRQNRAIFETVSNTTVIDGLLRQTERTVNRQLAILSKLHPQPKMFCGPWIWTVLPVLPLPPLLSLLPSLPLFPVLPLLPLLPMLPLRQSSVLPLLSMLPSFVMPLVIPTTDNLPVLLSLSVFRTRCLARWL
jgi:hypothetical protein